MNDCLLGDRLSICQPFSLKRLLTHNSSISSLHSSSIRMCCCSSGHDWFRDFPNCVKRNYPSHLTRRDKLKTMNPIWSLLFISGSLFWRCGTSPLWKFLLQDYSCFLDKHNHLVYDISYYWAVLLVWWTYLVNYTYTSIARYRLVSWS